MYSHSSSFNAVITWSDILSFWSYFFLFLLQNQQNNPSAFHTSQLKEVHFPLKINNMYYIPLYIPVLIHAGIFIHPFFYVISHENFLILIFHLRLLCILNLSTNFPIHIYHCVINGCLFILYQIRYTRVAFSLSIVIYALHKYRSQISVTVLCTV